jgi:tellurite resistance protein TehA-like permease
MKTIKSDLITKLEKKQKVMKLGKILFPIAAIIFLVFTVIMYGLLIKTIRTIEVRDYAPIASVTFTLFIINFGVFLCLAIQAWAGNPEREAIIQLLKEKR